MRASRAVRVAAIVVALAMVVGACGGDDADNDGVASLNDDPSRGEADGRQGIEDALLEFTRCLREEGLDVPDVQLDAEGAPMIGPEDVAGIDLDSPAVRAAFDACLPILTAAGAFSFGSDPELQALLQDSLQAFAECMRGEGISDFPDPDAGGSGVPFPITAFADFADDAFQDALDTCRDQIGFAGLDG